MKYIGMVIGFLAAGAVLFALVAWVVMLLAGAIAGYHDWYSIGFWETYLVLWLLGIVGRVWNTSPSEVQ